MQTTILSSKGQVVIPMSLRTAHNWQVGMALVVEDTPQGLLLRPLDASHFKLTHAQDVRGCMKYKGPALSLSDIDQKLALSFNEKYKRDNL